MDVILAITVACLVTYLVARRITNREQDARHHVEFIKLHSELEHLKLSLGDIGPPQVNVDLNPLREEMAKLPGKVLHTITGSTNNHKGALGELIGYLQLSAEYDRIIPLGSIVDFVAIKFPSSSCAGRIDFIDIKANKARLNKEQKHLQKLIEDKLIGFKKVKVETSDYQPGGH